MFHYKIDLIMRTRITKRMLFPYQNYFAEIAAKCNGESLWTDGIKFARPAFLH